MGGLQKKIPLVIEYLMAGKSSEEVADQLELKLVKGIEKVRIALEDAGMIKK
ncbi:hypothetical protein NDK43_25910 [Neobacillus pocheonensis]|uniref:Uncharacterized protein n=1 Tax=Neobacillus pocheonensis TaxID=363869 RepID=A0ABT0WHS4_9BACI|nr:hypothetical protein [Neobacillus pocheonensis]